MNTQAHDNRKRTAATTSRAEDSSDYGSKDLAAKPVWFLSSVKMGWFLIITSLIGLIASFDLSIEKVKKLEDPERVLSCDFNPFFSCGSVMEFDQAQVFGFPNQFIGIAAFIFPLLLGVLLASKAEVPGWVMVGLNLGLLGGLALVVFLYISSIYVIGIACPWCIVVWTVVIPKFFVTTGYNVLKGNFGSGLRDNMLARVLAEHSLFIAIVVLILIYASIVMTFSTFFASFFG